MMLRAALAYVARRPGGASWPLLPVSPTKGPVCEHGVYSGSTDPNEIRRMWADEPEANPAVRCEDFDVLDVDPRNGGAETLNQWGTRFGDLPSTWEAETGSKGSHFYFRPSPLLAGVPLGKIARGIDYKGNGRHYVLVPPSRSKAGVYRWVVRPTECDLAAPPEWLVDLILKVKTRPAHHEPVNMSKYESVDRVQLARECARTIRVAVSGNHGHDATIRAACVLVRGFNLTRGEGIDVMLEWNGRCVPPWDRAAIERKVDHTLEHGPAPMGFMLERIEQERKERERRRQQQQRRGRAA